MFDLLTSKCEFFTGNNRNKKLFKSNFEFNFVARYLPCYQYIEKYWAASQSYDQTANRATKSTYYVILISRAVVLGCFIIISRFSCDNDFIIDWEGSTFYIRMKQNHFKNKKSIVL